MAERRMFSKAIIDSDAFIDMPLSAQALYFHLGMRADDDGFINNPKQIQRAVSASVDDMNLLIAKRFIIPFASGVVAITHWRINNYIQKDRYKETLQLEEKAQLSVKENGMYTECIQNGYRLDTQVSIGKYSLGKYSLGKGSLDKDSKNKKPIRHKYGEYGNVLLSDEELEKLKTEFPYDWEMRIEKLSSYIESKGAKYKNHLATIRNWARRETEVKPSEMSEEEKRRRVEEYLNG